MIAGVWDSLSDLMVRVATFVDLFRWLFLGLLALAFLFLLAAGFVKLLDFLGGHRSVVTGEETSPSRFVARMDQAACIAISRRAKRRKRRHHRARMSSGHSS